jgi:hypothetical protein
MVLVGIIVGRRSTTRMARLFARIVKAMMPTWGKINDEFHEWRTDISWDEVLDWAVRDRSRR